MMEVLAGGAIESETRPVHVGIVYGAERIHFVAAADSVSALTQRLADYVRQKALVQLYPEDARRLGVLLASGKLEAAIRFYFERVGQRWDREWLEKTVVPMRSAIAAG